MVVAVGQLFAGKAADKWGVRPVILAYGVITLLATVGLLFADSVFQYHVLRAFQAFGCAGYGLSNALVQIHMPEASRLRARVIMTTASGVFISIAPLLGSILQLIWGWRGSFMVYGSLVFVLILALHYCLARPARPETQEGSALNAAGNEHFWLNSVISAFAFGVHFTFIIASPVVLLERLSMSAWEYAGLLLFYGVFYVVGGWVAAKVSAHLTFERQVFLGSTLMIAGAAGMVLLQRWGPAHAFSIAFPAMINVLGVCIVRPAAVCLAMNARPHQPNTASTSLSVVTFLIGGSLSLVAAKSLEIHDAWLGYCLLMQSLGCMSLAILGAVRHRRETPGREGELTTHPPSHHP